jgi:DNA-binding transcriptional ArsR family regulator
MVTAEKVGKPQPIASRHIDVLEKARLIVRERDAQWRRCHFQREPLMEANEWIGHYIAFWDGRLDALAKLVESLPPDPKKKPAPRKPRKVSR